MSTSLAERESYVPWTKDNSNDVEGGSTTDSLRECISFAATPEVLPSTYLNHFAAFFSLATNIALPGSLLQSLHQDISAASEELSVSTTPYAQGNQPESLPWLTVIKDGKDARKDNKQQDLEKEATAKELEFSWCQVELTFRLARSESRIKCLQVWQLPWLICSLVFATYFCGVELQEQL